MPSTLFEEKRPHNPDEPIPACNNEGPVRNARQCDAVVVNEILDPPGTAPSVEISRRGTQDAPIFRKLARDQAGVPRSGAIRIATSMPREMRSVTPSLSSRSIERPGFSSQESRNDGHHHLAAEGGGDRRTQQPGGALLAGDQYGASSFGGFHDARGVREESFALRRE